MSPKPPYISMQIRNNTRITQARTYRQNILLSDKFFPHGYPKTLFDRLVSIANEIHINIQ